MEVKSKTSLSDKVGLVGSLTASIILFFIALYSFVIDFFVEFNPTGILLDIIFIFIAFEVGLFATRTFGKVLYYEKIIDASFEKGIYRRLEPVLRKVAEVGVEIDEMKEEIDLVNRKVAALIDEQVNRSPELIAPGVTPKFATKTMLLAIFTMAGFLYVLEFPIGVAHYVTLIFYLVWWLFITNEFELFEETAAWIFVAIPILIVPIGAIFLHALFSLNAMIGILFGGLAVFVLVYYSWALYHKKGVLVFNLPAFRPPDTEKSRLWLHEKLAPFDGVLKDKKTLIIKSTDVMIVLLLLLLCAIVVYLFFL